MSECSKKPIWRTGLVFAASIVAAFGLWNLGGDPPVGVIAVVGLLLTAPFLNLRNSLGAQMVARAFWWQAALLGVLVLAGGHGSGEGALVLAGGGFAALAAAGRAGLDSVSTAFAPVEFRRTLMLSLVLGVADLVALAMYSLIMVEGAMDGFLFDYLDAVPFALGALAMAVSIFGLYRLKLWGLFACIGANVAVAVGALTVFDLPDPLMFGLCATAVAQLFLPLPVLRRIFAGRPQLGA